MADIQILVDKSPLPPGFSPVCDPLDSSEARVESWGRRARLSPCMEDLEGGWRDNRRAISESRPLPQCTGR